MHNDQIKSDIHKIYGTLRSELNSLSIPNIRNVAAAAGFDVTCIPSKSEEGGGMGSRAEVMPALDRLFAKMNPNDQLHTLSILAEKLTNWNSHIAANVQDLLARHGYQFIHGKFVPVGMLDDREKAYLPKSATTDLARAMSRLVDGDETGAITAACGAVDLVTQELYHKLSLGDPGKVSFQTKVNTLLQRLKIFEEMQNEFIKMGMIEKDAEEIVEQMKKAINHAAQFMQVLRRAMGDTHGSKAASRRTAFDSIKWASAICGLFQGYYER